MLVSGLIWKAAVVFALRLGWSKHSRRQQQFFPVGEDVLRDWKCPLTRFTFRITSALNWISIVVTFSTEAYPLTCIPFSLLFITLV